MRAYGDLNDLLSESSKAKKLYLSLPEYIQGSLAQRVDSIHSFEELQSCVKGLMHDEN